MAVIEKYITQSDHRPHQRAHVRGFASAKTGEDIGRL